MSELRPTPEGTGREGVSGGMWERRELRSPREPCHARLVGQPDPVRRRMLWRAECSCGWVSPTEHDSGAVLEYATAHDGLPLSLADRGFTVVAPPRR